MPWEVPLDAIHTIPALRDAKIYRPGYAIEYDYFDPTQLKQSLESKVIILDSIARTIDFSVTQGRNLMYSI